MQWSEIFGFNKKCQHNSVPMDVEIGYCPDCGELIENHWYITRCACCGVKERATIKNGEVVPQDAFCHNCGGKAYTVEQVKLDCININYAVLVREIVQNEISEYTQSWIDAMQTSGYIPKLLK
ncbi:hypothetical protein IJ541_06090 [bacterium]|nr:hypothetical protein [bacterium]